MSSKSAIGKPMPAAVSACAISAVIYQGLTVSTADGRPAQLAVVDEQGSVIVAGPEVAAAAWEASLKAYRQFLEGNGHMRTLVFAKRDVGSKLEETQP